MSDDPAGNAPTPAATAVGPPGRPAVDVCRTVMVIDGSYATIGARKMPGGRIDFVKFREELERQAGCRFRECWFFDHEPVRHKSAHQELSTQYTSLKLAPPHGPQFQLKLYAMKDYRCHCKKCGNHFTQLVQKGVDNGIATKILSLAYENVCDRFILFAGDGDFYDSLNQIKNILRKDLWVIGYRDTVSADLQQLASHVIWVEDLWGAIQTIPQAQSSRSQQQVEATISVIGSSASVHAIASTVEQASVETDRPKGDDPDSSSTRRVRLERLVDIDTDGEPISRSRAKYKRRRNDQRSRRNRSRSRSRSRSPRRQPPSEKTSETDDHPLFFIDTRATRRKDRQNTKHSLPSLTGPRPSSRPTPPQPLQVAEEVPPRPPRRDSGGRGVKRNRRDTPVLTFELSDMSSEEDEQHPLIHRAKTDSQGGQNGDIQIINLASDSE